jgi:agmatine deiminase
LWVDEGIIGDDTDGHIDDTVSFVNEDTVITVIEENKNDENYDLLANQSQTTATDAFVKRQTIKHC